MRPNKLLSIGLSLILFMIPALQSVRAVNLRTVDTHDGLSSMFVFKLFQDSIGYIWAGTYNGVSILEGNNSQVLDIGRSGVSTLTGSIVEDIQSTSTGLKWIHGGLALSCWDINSGELKRYPEINGTYRVAVSPGNEVIVYSRERGLMYYNRKSQLFLPFTLSHDLQLSDILYMAVDAHHTWIVVTRTSTILIELKEQDDGSMSFRIKAEHEHSMGTIRFASFNCGDMFYVTQNNVLFTTDLYGTKPQRQLQLSDELVRRGDISAIVRHGKRFIVGFYSGGAFELEPTEGGIIEDELKVTSGVFDIKRDLRQDIIWLATDGEGIKYYTKEAYDFHNELFDQLPFHVSKPVRALYKDENGDLLIATKGDGILIYRNYQPDGHHQGISQYTTANSVLLHDNNYCFAPGSHGLIWIGGDGRGVNYYDPSSRKFGTLLAGQQPISSIHAILEVDDELWAAIGQQGLIRIKLSWNGSTPIGTEVKQLLNKQESNAASQFISICAIGRTLWLGNRENGLVCLDRVTLKHKRIYFNAERQHPSNDVVCVTAAGHDGVLCSTSDGLFFQPTTADGQSSGAFEQLSDSSSLNNCPIRTSFFITKRNAWGSSSKNIFYSTSESDDFEFFVSNDQMQIKEFVEGAYFFDKRDGYKYFGGTNGFITVSPLKNRPAKFTPPLSFFAILLTENGFNVHTLKKDDVLRLKHNQNYVSIKYLPIDYLEADNYVFDYRLKDSKNDWTPNGNKREIIFTGIQPGHYTVQVRYHKGAYVSPIFEREFEVLPPWWFSWPMKSLYVLLALALIVAAIYRLIQRQRRRQQDIINRMNEQHREDVYESKLRFFTNITHEFSTPLTLISGPCQRILDTAGTSNIVKEYASIIKRNTQRLNELIQQLIEFRRIETGHREMQIAEVNVTERLAETVTNFRFESEQHQIDYKASIQPDILWATDLNAFTTICINLLSNAFKYVDEKGTIRVKMRVNEDGQLCLTVSNSGRGISQEEINRMFNRYVVLEDFEDKSATRGFARNGLGLAITQGLIKGLHGTIDVRGEDNLTTFTILLPRMEVQTDTPSPTMGYVATKQADPIPLLKIIEPQKIDEKKANIMLVDDDREMVWFLYNILKNDFNVFAFLNPEQALEQFKKIRIDLVVSDVIMEPFDGVELCRRIKGDELTKHIPVILLSSMHDDPTHVASATAGAELFMSKPFDLEYFRTVIDNQLKRNTILKDYFNSSISAFEVVGGKHIHGEDKELFDRITKIIDDNLSNPELSTQFIADQLAMSLRSMYRRLQTFTELTPKDMIRNARLQRAKQLLTQTGMSMEEVCYESGFGSRGTFYKLFEEEFGCTPKQYHEGQMKDAKAKLRKDEE